MSGTIVRKFDALITHTAASAGVNGDDISIAYHKGIILFINVSAVSGTPSLTVTLQGKDHVSGTYYTILASAAITATGMTVLRVHPGLTAAANSMANDLLPPTFRVITAISGGTPAVTATVSGAIY